MKEQDLIALGFVKEVISAEESGSPNYWYYYIYYLNKTLYLISSCNDEAKKEGWFVEFFDVDGIRFTNIRELAKLITLIENAKI